MPGLQGYTCSISVTDGRGGSATSTKTIAGVNQSPSVIHDGVYTGPPHVTTILRFNVTDDDPASTGACVGLDLGGDIGTVDGCDYLYESSWRIRLNLTANGIGDLSWRYRDRWGAEVVGSMQIRVQ